MRVVEVRSATRCAVCHDELDDAVSCVACDAQGHAECWAELGRCSSLGCGTSLTFRTAPPACVPRWRRVVTLAVGTQLFVRSDPVGKDHPPPAAVRGGFRSVLALIAVGLCAACVLVNLGGQSCYSRSHRVAADMKAIGDALDLFRVDCGYYPDSLDALWVRPANARKWGPEPYLKEYPPKDPWGNEYVYRYEPGRRPEIVSLGADGKRGCWCMDCDLSSRTINDQVSGR